MNATMNHQAETLLEDPSSVIQAIEGPDHHTSGTPSDDTETAFASSLPGMVVHFRDLTLTASAASYPSVIGTPMQGATLLTPFMKLAQRLFSKHEDVKKHVLQNVTGAFRPGRVTLVLGDTGSGRTTLMKLLSGRLRMASSIAITGDVRYNNETRQNVLHHVQRCVGYADSHDHHLGGMTVQETLEFAHACSIGSYMPQWTSQVVSKEDDAVQLGEAYRRHALHFNIKQLGLENYKDVLVEKLSPGDKKRLTIAEMAVGPKSVYCIDESAISLDADTIMEIVEAMRNIAVRFNRTVVTSLHHSTPEVFALFDDIMVLSRGHMIYHGPRSQVLEYFHGLGLDCPAHKDVTSFLLELGATQHTVRPGMCDDVNSPVGLADIFQRSVIYLENLKYLDDLTQSASVNPLPHPRVFEASTMSSLSEVSLLFRRQWLLAKRNKAFVIGKGILMVVLALIYGATFWQIPDNPPPFMFGLAFSCTFLLAMSRALFLGQFGGAKAVFFKHQCGKYFTPPTYVFASVLVQAPSCMIDALIFGSCLYWMGGYAARADHFLVFLTTLGLCQICLVAFFFFLSSILPSLAVAFPAVITSAMFFVTFSGFLATRKNIPGYLIWIYWMNPFAWTIRGLTIDQFSVPEFQVCVHKGKNYCVLHGGQTMAKYSLAFYDLEDDSAWIFYSWLALIAGAVLYGSLASIVLAFKSDDIDVETSPTVILDRHRHDTMQKPAEVETQSIFALINTPRRPIVSEVALEVSRDQRSTASVAVVLRDLEVKTVDDILFENVTAFAWTGTMTAVIGTRRSAIKALLEVIGGRRSATDGEVELNGVSMSTDTLRRYVGYCDAMDVFAESSTFSETLLLAAMLRRGDTLSVSERYNVVDECLELFQLRPVANRIIRGANPELLKKLGIAVELAAGKSVLVLEDRTHGVSSSAVKRILACLRRVADSGRTVIFALQQPNLPLHLLDVCDRALVLHHDGGIAFFGHPGHDASQVIEGLRGPSSKTSVKIIRSVLTAAEEPSSVDPVRISTSITAGLKGLGESSPHLAKIELSAIRPAPWTIQIVQLTKRCTLTQWRSPLLNVPRVFVTALLGLLLGILLHNADYHVYRGATSGVGMFYITAILLGAVSFNGYIGFAAADKALVRRDRHVHNSYSVLWYGIASTLSELPYTAFASLLFVCILFPLTHIDSSHIPYGWLVVWLHMTTNMHIAQFFVFALPTPDYASGIAILLIIMSFLFTGFNPPTSHLHKGMMWLHHALPAKYTLASLAGRIFGTCSTPGGSEPGCQVLEQAAPRFEGDTLHEYLIHAYGIDSNHAWRNLLTLAGIGIVFRVLALLVLRFKK